MCLNNHVPGIILSRSILPVNLLLLKPYVYGKNGKTREPVKRENVINIELAGEVDVGKGWLDDVSI